MRRMFSLRLLGLLTGCAVIIIGCSSGGLSACTHFTNVLAEAREGLLTGEVVEAKMREVLSSAAGAEPDIETAADALLRSATHRNQDTFMAAAADMRAACSRAGY